MAENTEKPGNDDAQVQDALDQARTAVGEMQQSVEEAAGGQTFGESAVDSARAFGTATLDPSASKIELLADVDLTVSIELGRTRMLVEDVLKLGDGSVVELDKLAGDPVDVFVNGRLVARGEVLVLNDNFCVRISEIVANLEEEAGAIAGQQ